MFNSPHLLTGNCSVSSLANPNSAISFKRRSEKSRSSDFWDRTCSHWSDFSAAVVMMALVGLADPIFSKMLMNDAFYKTPFRLVFLGLTVGLTATSAVFLDRTQRWRNTHIILNSVATVLFLAQGFTGSRDLLEIPLSWQKPYIQQLFKSSCQTQPCTVEVKPKAVL